MRPFPTLAPFLLLLASLSATPVQAGCPPVGCITVPQEVPCLPEMVDLECLTEPVCELTALDLLPVHPCEDSVPLPPCPPSTTGVVVGPAEACVGHGPCPPGSVGHRVWLSVVTTTLGVACVKASPCVYPQLGAEVEVLGGPTVGDCLQRQPLPVPIDTDFDLVEDDVDNCPRVANPDQRDTDGDGLGDKGDPDMDGDHAPNGTDADTDGDGWANDSPPGGGDQDDDNDGQDDMVDPSPTGPTTPLG